MGRAPGRGKSSRPPGRPTSHSGLYAREKLLEAATEFFAKQGVAATTFAMIAARAELTPAMLHYYFRDRDQMLDAVVEERLAPLIAGVWGPVATGEAPAELIRRDRGANAGRDREDAMGAIDMDAGGAERRRPVAWESASASAVRKDRNFKPECGKGAGRRHGEYRDRSRIDCVFADWAADDAHGNNQFVGRGLWAQGSGSRSTKPAHYGAADPRIAERKATGRKWAKAGNPAGRLDCGLTGR